MKSIFILLAVLTNLSCSNFQKQAEGDSFADLAPIALEEFRAVCKSDNAALWNQSLCVPMIIIDRKTMDAVATQQSPDQKLNQSKGLFFGKYTGPKIYANTSIEWNKKRWSMVMWPLPKEKDDRIELLIHEAWHSIQNNLNLPLNNSFLEHLDQYDGRLLIRLEWTALLKALKDKKKQGLHLTNALHFRNLRFKKYPSAKSKENSLDLNEGLAAYTGLKLKTPSYDKQVSYLESKLKKVPKLTSLTRSASYYTGPLYGLLLDKLKPNWKLTASQIKDLGDALEIDVSKIETLPNTEVLSIYNFKTINVFETARSKKNTTKISKYLDQISKVGSLKINSGPKTMFMFDPNGILVVGEGDFIYTYYEVRDTWGRLKVFDGARVKRIGNNLTIMVSPPQKTDELNIKGENWTLKLNPGWKIKKDKNFTTLIKI